MTTVPKHLPRGEWSEQAVKVLRERYLLRDEAGEVSETPDEMCWRVASHVATAENRYGLTHSDQIAEIFYQMMVAREFLPGSPTLMNAGTDNGQQFSSCFVLPVEDSIVGIYDALKWQALIHKSGGGTGFSFSKLRPNGARVKSTSGVASGPVSFMKVFDASTEHIKQGGRRRGANMGVLRVDHPDVMEFIECKLHGGISNFNISVAITDDFMDALTNPLYDGKYNLLDPQTKQVVGVQDARLVWSDILEAAWKTGDPGLFFIDRVNASRANPVPSLGPIEACNPCGEQPLYDFDLCNLGSINLELLVSTSDEKFNWNRLGRVTEVAVQFLDDVIDLNPYPLPEIEHNALGLRRIGLGVMGWADALFKLGIPYDSDEALDLAKRVMSFIHTRALFKSQELARERGVFPWFSESIYHKGTPVRNSSLTTIAPTGTISVIAGASSGIEPQFALAYQHKVKLPDGSTRILDFVNPVFEQYVKDRQPAWGESILAEAKQTGRCPDGFASLKRVFKTAHDITPEWHVRMQSAFQSVIDNGVSKTVNLPHDATVQDVEDAYLLAWSSGCLGVTVFRDGCKDTQVLYAGVKEVEKTVTKSTEVLDQVKARPVTVSGSTHRMDTPLGTGYVTVNRNGGGHPFETFINLGKAGSDVAAISEALGRLVSLVLRLPSSMDPTRRLEKVIDQLSGIGGGRSLGFGSDKVRSLPDALAGALRRELGVLDGGVKEPPTEVEPARFGDLCPECGNGTLVHTEGCEKCFTCDFSAC